MTKEEFGMIVIAIRSAYNKVSFLENTSDKKLWYEMLKDVDYRTASKNLERHVRENKFPPTIAELRGTGKKSFGNFQEREYNMEQLELALLGVIPGSAVQMIEEESQ